jgi:hypothetical protein
VAFYPSSLGHSKLLPWVVVSYFAVFLCDFASWRENCGSKRHLMQRREGAKTRKAKLRPATSATPNGQSVSFFDGISTTISALSSSHQCDSQLGQSFKLKEPARLTDHSAIVIAWTPIFLRKFFYSAGGTAFAIARE